MDIKTDKRVNYIDLFRAFGIICMVFSHVYFGHIIDKWIHVFHMPMFFVIAGFFYKERNFKEFIFNKVRSLLFPYFVFGLFHFIISCICIGSIDYNFLYSWFWNNTDKGGIPICGALWFLTAIFISELIYFVIKKNISSILISSIVCALVSVLGIFFSTFLPVKLPYALDAGLVGVAFCQIGGIVKTYSNKILNINIILSVLGLICSSILSFINGYVNLREGTYGIWPLFYICSTIMIISLWNIFRILYNKLNEKHILLIERFINPIGKNSIVYLCLNQLIIIICTKIINLIIHTETTVITIISKMLTFVFSLIILFLLQHIITKTKLKILLGR